MIATAPAKPARSATVLGRSRRPLPPSACQARDEAPVPALTSALSARWVSACIQAYSGDSTAS